MATQTSTTTVPPIPSIHIRPLVVFAKKTPSSTVMSVMSANVPGTIQSNMIYRNLPNSLSSTTPSSSSTQQSQSSELSIGGTSVSAAVTQPPSSGAGNQVCRLLRPVHAFTQNAPAASLQDKVPLLPVTQRLTLDELKNLPLPPLPSKVSSGSQILTDVPGPSSDSTSLTDEVSSDGQILTDVSGPSSDSTSPADEVSSDSQILTDVSGPSSDSTSLTNESITTDSQDTKSPDNNALTPPEAPPPRTDDQLEPFALATGGHDDMLRTILNSANSPNKNVIKKNCENTLNTPPPKAGSMLSYLQQRAQAQATLHVMKYLREQGNLSYEKLPPSQQKEVQQIVEKAKLPSVPAVRKDLDISNVQTIETLNDEGAMKQDLVSYTDFFGKQRIGILTRYVGESKSVKMLMQLKAMEFTSGPLSEISPEKHSQQIAERSQIANRITEKIFAAPNGQNPQKPAPRSFPVKNNDASNMVGVITEIDQGVTSGKQVLALNKQSSLNFSWDVGNSLNQLSTLQLTDYISGIKRNPENSIKCIDVNLKYQFLGMPDYSPLDAGFINLSQTEQDASLNSVKYADGNVYDAIMGLTIDDLGIIFLQNGLDVEGPEFRNAWNRVLTCKNYLSKLASNGKIIRNAHLWEKGRTQREFLDDPGSYARVLIPYI
ncbi:MAG: hypothetical protein LBT98_01540 [Puniceicoccales bacterium]|nr:hypothetical protein [Puniceicoccales bacterium]